MPQMFNSFEDVVGEILRRIKLLGRAPELYEDLSLRLNAQAAIDIRKQASDPRFDAHQGYADTVDVFETPEGLAVSVPEGMELSALRAELGTTSQRLQPLWRPRFRQQVMKARLTAERLAEIVAQKVVDGETLEEFDLDRVVNMPEVPSAPDMESLRDIVKARRQQMASRKR